jgi:NADH-quinone oxidoreductase subunit H
MILVSALCSIMFLGGWLSPLPFIPDSFLWLAAKVSVVLFLFIWFRATFPRYRYDQIMRLGWKVFIPLTLLWVVVIGVWMRTPLWYWG